MTVQDSVTRGWATWGGLLALATVVLIGARDDIDLSYAVLTMMLIVLGGSAAGGRLLGFGLALASFVLIDYCFQRPYYLFSVNKPLDGLVLIAFLAAAGVATDLLARARQEAAAARQRASEVESLSRLGAATLRHAKPQENLDALATLVRETIGAGVCAILRRDGVGMLTIASRSVASTSDAPDALLEQRAARRAVERGIPVSIASDGTCVEHDASRFADSAAPTLEADVVALPLVADIRTIGALAVRGRPDLTLDAPRRRLLAALGYYAALALERGRLLEEAAHSHALREANRAKDQILASVSHDLRTPLTTIKVLAQGAESRGERSAGAIVEQADRLTRLVGDLLELSRIRTGLSSAPELNTAEDIVGATVRQTQGILGSKRVVPHIDLDSPVLLGMFDFVQTLRILGNLIDNALRFTPAGGVVDLDVRREDDELVFAVSDRGAGVPAEERDRIFDAFYRPAGSTPDTGHAGLGLSIARTLAELQGGTLTFALRAGGGSTFTLRLPAADVPEPAIEDLA